MKRAMTFAFFAFGLALPTQAAAPGKDYRLPPEDPVKAAHAKYTMTVEIVSDERLKRLSKLFRQTDHTKGVAIWRAVSKPRKRTAPVGGASWKSVFR